MSSRGPPAAARVLAWDAGDALPAIATDIRAVRLFNANVYAGDNQASGIAGEIIAARPDVVFLQEPTPAIIESLDAAGALTDLRYRITVARTDPFAGLVAARWPPLDHQVVDVDGRPVLIRATVETEGGPLASTRCTSSPRSVQDGNRGSGSSGASPIWCGPSSFLSSWPATSTPRGATGPSVAESTPA